MFRKKSITFPPEFIPAYWNRSHETFFKRVTDARSRFDIMFDGKVKISHNPDFKYYICDHSWVKKIGRWWVGQLQKARFCNRLKYHPEGVDCDDFAICLRGLISFSPIKHNKGGILFSRVTVRRKDHSFHKMNLFVSDFGVFLFEPQTGSITEKICDLDFFTFPRPIETNHLSVKIIEINI